MRTATVGNLKALYFKIICLYMLCFIKKKMFFQLQNVIVGLIAALCCHIYGALICLPEKGTLYYTFCYIIIH